VKSTTPSNEPRTRSNWPQRRRSAASRSNRLRRLLKIRNRDTPAIKKQINYDAQEKAKAELRKEENIERLAKDKFENLDKELERLKELYTGEVTEYVTGAHARDFDREMHKFVTDQAAIFERKRLVQQAAALEAEVKRATDAVRVNQTTSEEKTTPKEESAKKESAKKESAKKGSAKKESAKKGSAKKGSPQKGSTKKVKVKGTKAKGGD